MKTKTHLRHNIGAFTLVELIVVIAILAILGTIAFLSLAGFSGSARDSSRISDLANLSKSLELYNVQVGSYPKPDNAFSVTYSGGVLWNEGTVGSTVINAITAGGIKISRKPMDPLITAKEYTYSTTAFGSAYQVKTDYEGDNVSFQSAVPGFDTALAASGNPTITYVKGNYNGIVAKTQTGGVIYIVAVPSLFMNTGLGTVVLPATATGFYLHGQTNSGGVLFTPKLVFSSWALPGNDSERILFASGIANAYSGTILANQSSIALFISTLSSNSTGSLASLGGSLVSGSLGGSATTNSGSTPSVPAYSLVSSTAAYTAGMQFTYSGVTITVSSAGIGTGSSTYAGCDTPDIVLWASGYNPQIWSACNVGASTSAGFATVPGQGPSSPTVPGNRLTNVQGNYYQWGRNDDVTVGTWKAAQQFTSALTSPANTAGNTNFYQGDDGAADWYNYNGQAGNITPIRWNTANGGDNNLPCATGYHVPTNDSTVNSDWPKASQLIVGTISPSGANLNTIRSTMKIPLAGYRNWSDGRYNNQGANGYYWSSNPSGSSAYYTTFSSGAGNIAGSDYRAQGFSVRCIKN